MSDGWEEYSWTIRVRSYARGEFPWACWTVPGTIGVVPMDCNNDIKFLGDPTREHLVHRIALIVVQLILRPLR